MIQANSYEELKRRLAEAEAALAKEKAERLRENQLWQAMLENIPDIIIRCDLDGTLLYTNKVIPPIKLEDVIGSSIYKWMDPVSHELSDQALARMKETLEPQNYEIKGRDSVNNGYWWNNRLAPVLQDGKLVGFSYISTDVTRLKKIEEELRKSAAELARSNEELRQFAYVASHDMHEPLRMIASYLDLLQRRYGGKLEQDGKEFLGHALDGANRLRALIDGLLEYARVGNNPSPREPIELSDIFIVARKDLQVAIEQSGVDVRVGAMPKVIGDRLLLTRAVENLLANAIKFRAPVQPYVEVSAEKEGGETWRITIRDNGTGAEPQDIPKLFQLFSRLGAPSTVEGTGLGLSICKKIIEQHGGRIWAESAGLGKGMSFHFTLPAAA